LLSIKRKREKENINGKATPRRGISSHIED
jgi:hypothetical protein